MNKLENLLTKRKNQKSKKNLEEIKKIEER